MFRSPLNGPVNSEPPQTRRPGAMRRPVTARETANTGAKRTERAAPLTGRRDRPEVGGTRFGRTGEERTAVKREDVGMRSAKEPNGARLSRWWTRLAWSASVSLLM